jgi:hypothetical protein
MGKAANGCARCMGSSADRGQDVALTASTLCYTGNRSREERSRKMQAPIKTSAESE